MKSLEFVKGFIKENIENGYWTDISIEEFQNMKEHNFMEYLEHGNLLNLYALFENNTLISTANDESINKSLKIIIQYDNDAQFQYSDVQECRCDGSLMFFNSLKGKLVDGLLGCETLYPEATPDDYETNFWDYDIKYTVGDFVVNYQSGDFGTEEKPWMNSWFVVFLPIRCEFINNK